MATPAFAGCEGPSLAGEVLSLARRSDLRVVFNPVRLQGRCVSGFTRTRDAHSDLRRLARIAGMEVVALGDGLFALNPSSPVALTAEDRPTQLSDIVVFAPADQPDPSAPRGTEPIEQERRAVGTVDFVSVGDVGLQSQTSIADLAKRLPGVSVSWDQRRNQSATGETQYGAIRGFDTSFNAYTLDGVRLPQTSGGRSISLNLFSPFAVGGIGVDKTPGADEDADTIAGIVDLTTPSAFDFDDPLLRVRAVGQLADLARERDQDALGGAIGIDAARRFGDRGQWGLYAVVYRERRDSAAESISVQNDYVTARADVGTARANPNALAPDGLQWNVINSEIQRYGMATALGYRTVPLEMFARLNYAVYENTNTLNQAALRSELTRGQTNPNPGGSLYNAAGDYTPFGINPASYFRVEDIEQALFLAQVGGKMRFGALTASLEAAYADGRFDSPDRIEAAWRGVTYNGAPGNTGVSTEGLVIDLSRPRSPRPVLSPGAVAYVSSLERPQQIYVQSGYALFAEQKTTVRGDLTWAGTGLVSRVSVGGLHEAVDQTDRTLAGDATRYRFRTPLQAGTVDGPTIGSYPGQSVNGFLDHTPVRPLRLVDRGAVEAQLAQFGPGVAVSQNTINQGLSQGQDVRSAAYVTATLKLADGAVEIIPGLRYEDNRFEARFFLNDADGARFVSANRDYSHLAPSLLGVWRPSDTLVVRAAVRSSYSRPAGSQLAGPTVISRDPITNAILSITQPNPDLKPVEAWNYDLGLEYYGRDGAFLQIQAYHKDLENIVVPTALRSTSQTLDGIVYIRPFNGLRGSATGVEIAGRYDLADRFPDSWIDGFSLGGNVTCQTATAAYRISPTDLRSTDLPQAPDLIYNAELSYARGPLRANLSYNYTGLRLDVVQDSQPDIYTQPVGELNLGVAYALSPALEIGASVRNLTDEPTYWSTVGPSKTYVSNDRNGGYLETGRVFQISLRWQASLR